MRASFNDEKTHLNFRSIFARNKLLPSWSYSPEGIIWRLLFGDHERILGESRNDSKKTVSFFCLAEKTGSPLWQNRTLTEPWWVGMEAVHKDVLLLHGFQKPDLPGHYGIFAWNTMDGRELWRNEELTFWFCHGEKVYAYQTLFEKRVGYALELQTGKVVQMFDEGIEELSGLRRSAVQEMPEDRVRFPEILGQGAASDQILSMVEKEISKKELVGAAEFLFENPYLIVNYHLPVRNSSPESLKLENHLAILDSRNGKRAFTEILTSEASAPVPDSFFLREGVLFFVKQQRILTALTLGSSSSKR